MVLAKDIVGMSVDTEEVFDTLCQACNTELLIIMGHNQQRDILIYHSKDDERHAEFSGKLAEALCTHLEIGASLSMELSKFPRTCYIEQANATFTRKKLLPVMLSVNK